MAAANPGKRALPLPYLTLVLPVVVVVVVAFVVPVLFVLVRAFTDPQVGLQNFVWLFTESFNLELLWRTIRLAFTATVVTALLGYPFAYLIATSSKRVAGILMLIVLLPFWTSMMVRTFAWIIILQPNGVLNSILGPLGVPTISLLGTQTAVLIGMCQVLMPFMVLPMASVMQSIDMRIPLAAQIFGAHPAKAFAQVYLPMSLPGVFSGTLIVFILSLGFYVTPALLGSPREQILPNALFSQINELLNWGHGGALAWALLLTVGLVFVVVFWVARILGIKVQNIGGAQV
ncbi:ABC transporter permease [Brevibacterium samyangense]|uniref:ABC transmembrane type-1 domain-containing protein n=1 Tax=Brevibacterium samyangense TaxID=366888 RepID=A0ABN2TBU0_9MICO